jgi:hypothetical protein
VFTVSQKWDLKILFKRIARFKKAGAESRLNIPLRNDRAFPQAQHGPSNRIQSTASNNMVSLIGSTRRTTLEW